MQIVVVMPFDPNFDVVYGAIKSTVQSTFPSNVATCLRIDEDYKPGRITEKIKDHLRSADLCIADITGINANVMWEMGFAEALQKPLIVLSQTTTNLPFNIQDIKVIGYAPADIEGTLVNPLQKALQQATATNAAQHTRLTIAITGSRSVAYGKALNSIRAFATPFLSQETVWYCGTNGPVDEAAATFLLEAGQHVLGVHATGYDATSEIEGIFVRHNAALVNADMVPLSRGYRELGRRDALFVNKADLFFLVWDGKSPNTRLLHEWLTSNNKDHIVAFA